MNLLYWLGDYLTSSTKQNAQTSNKKKKKGKTFHLRISLKRKYSIQDDHTPEYGTEISGQLNKGKKKKKKGFKKM